MVSGANGQRRVRSNVKPVGSDSGSDGEPSGHAELYAPRPVAPPNGTVFNHYPRETVLQWEAAPGAASYKVEIDFRSNNWASETGQSQIQAGVRTTHYAFDFVGAQPGRWRVWAVDADDREGPKSQWWEFRYSR